MSIKIEQKGRILTAESAPYDVNGNTGVSHRIRVSVEGEIYPCKSNAQQISEVQKYVGQEGVVALSLDSRKEALNLVLEGFKPTK